MLIKLRKMNNLLRVIGRDQSKGIYEYSSGLLTTTALVLAGWLNALANGQNWMLGMYKVFVSGTSDVPNAMSFNNVTGVMYCSDAIVCQWNPNIWGAVWGTNSTKSLWAPNQTVLCTSGVNRVYSAGISGPTLGFGHGDANPDRTATNIATAVNSFDFLVGFYRK